MQAFLLLLLYHIRNTHEHHNLSSKQSQQEQKETSFGSMVSVTYPMVVALMLLLVAEVKVMGEDSSLQTRCSDDFTKLTNCLGYATGKDDQPSGDCCSSVSDIKGRDPVCLCYIIQQTHNGLSSAKSLGLQFSRLVQLPDACKLANSSISNCPKLLNIPPSSPDYAIFTNTTKASSPTTGTATGSPPSAGVKHQILFVGSFCIAVASAIFLSIF